MPKRARYYMSQTGFLADSASAVIAPGAQIDWSKVADAEGGKLLLAGTVVSLTPTGLAPRSAVDAPASGIMIHTAAEGDPAAGLSGSAYYVGGVIYQNLLPEHDSPNFEAYKTELKAAGTGFLFLDYSDSRTGLPLEVTPRKVKGGN